MEASEKLKLKMMVNKKKDTLGKGIRALLSEIDEATDVLK